MQAIITKETKHKEKTYLNTQRKHRLGAA